MDPTSAWTERRAPHALLGADERAFVLGRFLGEGALRAAVAADDSYRGAADVLAIRQTLDLFTSQRLMRVSGAQDLGTFLEELPHRITRDLGLDRPVPRIFQEVYEQRARWFFEAETDPFEKVFETVRRASLEIYGFDDDDDRPPLRYLFDLVRAGSPHALPSSVWVAGRTTSRAQGRRRELYVTFSAAKLRHEDWCVVPYVICHELVVHHLAHPDHLRSNDGFAEGWMDVVASQLGSILAGEADRSEEPSGFPPRSGPIAGSFHDDRFMPGDAPVAAGVDQAMALNARIWARYAAVHLRAQLQKHLGPEGTQVFVCLSAALNAAPLSIDVRKALVTALVPNPAESTAPPIDLAAMDAAAACIGQDQNGAAMAFAEAIVDPVFHRHLP